MLVICLNLTNVFHRICLCCLLGFHHLKILPSLGPIQLYLADVVSWSFIVFLVIEKFIWGFQPSRPTTNFKTWNNGPTSLSFSIKYYA